MKAPLVPLALAFAAGVSLGLEASPPRWLLPAALGLGVLAAAAVARRRLAAAGATVLLLVALAGWARVALPDPWPALVGLRGGPTRM